MSWDPPKSLTHFDGRRFFNPHRPEDHGAAGALKWALNRTSAPWSKTPVSPASKPLDRVADHEMIAHWVGHSTVLLQWSGLNILTDPVWSKRISPIPGIGMGRYAEPGLAFDDLPPIDLVLVSHDHYDHLDAPTIKKLIRVHDPHFFVPLGLKAWFGSRGTERVTELDWWERTENTAFAVTAVPVQHFSGRGPFDRNKTLWAGFVVEVGGERFFFAGDTGYSPDFEEIGRVFAPFRFAAIPIGAYDPQWFMAPVHINPEEAVAIHLDIGSECSLGIHHGTFKLTDEPQGEPIERLSAELARRGLSQAGFQTVPHGGSTIVPPIQRDVRATG